MNRSVRSSARSHVQDDAAARTVLDDDEPRAVAPQHGIDFRRGLNSIFDAQLSHQRRGQQFVGAQNDQAHRGIVLAHEEHEVAGVNRGAVKDGRRRRQAQDVSCRRFVARRLQVGLAEPVASCNPAATRSSIDAAARRPAAARSRRGLPRRCNRRERRGSNSGPARSRRSTPRRTPAPIAIQIAAGTIRRSRLTIAAAPPQSTAMNSGRSLLIVPSMPPIAGSSTPRSST